MFESLLIFSPYSSLLTGAKRDVKVKWHWILQVASIICISLGFLAIYQNKNRNNKDHFVSYHGKMGVISTILAVLQAVMGTNLLYWKSALLNPLGLKLATRKQLHAMFGVIVFLLGCGSMILSLYSNFMLKNTSEMSWYGTLFLIMFIASIPANQVANVYIHKKIPAKWYGNMYSIIYMAIHNIFRSILNILAYSTYWFWRFKASIEDFYSDNHDIFLRKLEHCLWSA